MSYPKTTEPYFRQERWLSVYGASVATQVQQHLAEGRGAPDDGQMIRIVEEAVTIADMAEDALKEFLSP